MDERLQQAIDAIRTNDKAKAQQLLAQFLKSNPNHPQGWFLLSQVVADKKQQVAFLNKTLTLDPEHRQAQQKLMAMGEAASEPVAADEGLIATQSSQPVSQGVVDFAEQAEARTIPPWMSGQVTHEVEDAAADMSPAQVNEPPPRASTELPDWLQEPPAAPWQEEDGPEEDDVIIADGAAPSPLAKPQEPALAKKAAAAKSVTVDKGMESLPWYFYLLLVLAFVIVLIILLQFASLFGKNF